MLFVLLEASFPVLADEVAAMPVPIAAANLPPASHDFFENHRLELGSMNSDKPFVFNDEEPPQLFTSLPAGEPNPNEPDWDYLWRNASRIPITSIPEPTIGSLLIGGAILLCRLRMRKTLK